MGNHIDISSLCCHVSPCEIEYISNFTGDDYINNYKVQKQISTVLMMVKLGFDIMVFKDDFSFILNNQRESIELNGMDSAFFVYSVDCCGNISE